MIFGKLLKDIDANDIEQLWKLQIPESDQLEYKEFVPGESGPDNWHKDQKGISNYGRDKILAEVVAFANFHGGQVIIGVQESADSPKRALAITPVPQCADLAERLRRMATDCIEPRLTGLQVTSIATDAAGGGVVIIQVAASQSAPHRLATKLEAYVRHGEDTKRMTMREIQDMTLNAQRGLERVYHRLGGFRSQFEQMRPFFDPVGKSVDIGVRCSIVPLQPINIPASVIQQEIKKGKRTFKVEFNSGKPEQYLLPVMGEQTRPVLRGESSYQHGTDKMFEQTIYRDGSQNLVFIKTSPTTETGAARLSQDPHLFHIGWIMGAALSALFSAQSLAIAIGSPGIEYAVELHVMGQGRSPVIVIGNYTLSRELPTRNFTFPQYSFLPDDGLVSILNVILEDFWNSTGDRPEETATVVS